MCASIIQFSKKETPEKVGEKMSTVHTLKSLPEDKRPYTSGILKKKQCFMPINQATIDANVSFWDLEEWKDDDDNMYVLRRVVFSKHCVEIFELYKEKNESLVMDGPDVFQVHRCTKLAKNKENNNSQKYAYSDVVATVYQPLVSKIPVVDLQFEKTGELKCMTIKSDRDAQKVIDTLTDEFNITSAYEFTKNTFLKSFVYA